MNRYFFLIACLQLWKEITPVNPVTTWAPLLLIFLVSALKEGVDDYRRHQADAIVNNRKTTVIKNGVKVQVWRILLGFLNDLDSVSGSNGRRYRLYGRYGKCPS